MLEKRTLTMSIKEIKQCEVIKMVKEKKITQREGTRQICAGLHQPKIRKIDKVHPLRERRQRRGEFVQNDGSYHARLEDRAEKACLLLYVFVIFTRPSFQMWNKEPFPAFPMNK